MDRPIPASKTCRRCRQTKPAAAFGRKPAMRDGLQSWCAACIRERSRELRRAAGQQPARRRVRIRPGWVRCAACGRDLPESEFRPDGRGKPSSYCRQCQNRYLAELNRAKRKDPAFRAKVRATERRRRAAEKREVRTEREHRLRSCQEAIARLKADGWSLRRLAAASGLHRTTLSRIVAGRYVPYQETHRRLVGFARRVSP